VRRDMLQEAVEVMRLLWSGGWHSHRGKYYTVEHARLYSLPEQPIPIYVAAEGPLSAKLAGRIGDGLIGSVRDKEVLAAFEQNGGEGKPRHGWVTMCWAQSKEEAVRTVHDRWPHILLGGRLARDLPLPQHFEEAARFVTEEMIAKAILCGPDPEPCFQRIEEYRQAGFTHVHLLQLGPEQESFLQFFEQKIAPRLASTEA
jgi:coenzyme F420-dependent glucose-6-phosphate dehydrogenase